jgi:hypothetical protein
LNQNWKLILYIFRNKTGSVASATRFFKYENGTERKKGWELLKHDGLIKKIFGQSIRTLPPKVFIRFLGGSSNLGSLFHTIHWF